MPSLKARLRSSALRAGFRAGALLPEPAKAMARRGPLGRVASRFLASNSTAAADAYGAVELQAAIRAAVPAGAPDHVALLDPSTRARVLTADPVVVDLSTSGDRDTLNSLNLLRHSGAVRARILPSAAVLGRAKQAVGPYVNDGTFRTVARVHNYFAKNYAIKDAILVVVLAELRGVLQPLASFVLGADETVTWTSADVDLRATVDDGATLLFVAAHPNLGRVPTREFRVIVSVETDHGRAAVHSLPASRFEVAQPATNGTKGHLTPETRRLHLGAVSVGWDGRSSSAVVGAAIDVAGPGGDGQGWGAVLARFDEPVRSTPRFYVATDDDQHVVMHHDHGPHPKPDRQLVPSEGYLASRHLACLAAPLLHHKDVDLSLVIDPRNMSNTYRTMQVAICDDSGAVRADRHVELEGPLTVVDTAGMRREAGLAPDACGYVRVTPVVEGAVVRELDDTPMLYAYYRSGGHALDTVEAGSSAYADYEPILEPGYDDTRSLAHRANKFAPIAVEPSTATFVWAVNVGSSKHQGDVPLTLSLRWRGGSSSRTLVLAPGEARLWDLDREFDLDPADRPDAAVWLESSAANVFAVYLYDDRDDPLRFGLDHLTGG